MLAALAGGRRCRPGSWQPGRGAPGDRHRAPAQAGGRRSGPGPGPQAGIVTTSWPAPRSAGARGAGPARPAGGDPRYGRSGPPPPSPRRGPATTTSPGGAGPAAGPASRGGRAAPGGRLGSPVDLRWPRADGRAGRSTSTRLLASRRVFARRWWTGRTGGTPVRALRRRSPGILARGWLRRGTGRELRVTDATTASWIAGWRGRRLTSGGLGRSVTGWPGPGRAPARV